MGMPGLKMKDSDDEDEDNNDGTDDDDDDDVIILPEIVLTIREAYSIVLSFTELCWITEDVRLSRYLHNSTLANMSDYTVNLQYYNYIVEHCIVEYWGCNPQKLRFLQSKGIKIP